MNNLAFCQAAAESLPVESRAIDVALLNGIFNLNPAQEAVFTQLRGYVRQRRATVAVRLAYAVATFRPRLSGRAVPRPAPLNQGFPPHRVI